jgi:hypothetical protein
MFVEGYVGKGTDRDAAQFLMRELDDAAAQEKHRVVGEVTISEFESPLSGRCLRLEAEVIPAV